MFAMVTSIESCVCVTSEEEKGICVHSKTSWNLRRFVRARLGYDVDPMILLLAKRLSCSRTNMNRDGGGCGCRPTCEAGDEVMRKNTLGQTRR